MQEDFVKAWNLSDLDEDLELISRTSNGLERYNRRMGGLNPTSHPRLGTFVSNLKIEELRLIINSSVLRILSTNGRTLPHTRKLSFLQSPKNMRATVASQAQYRRRRRGGLARGSKAINTTFAYVR